MFRAYSAYVGYSTIPEDRLEVLKSLLVVIAFQLSSTNIHVTKVIRIATTRDEPMHFAHAESTCSPLHKNICSCL